MRRMLCHLSYQCWYSSSQKLVVYTHVGLTRMPRSSLIHHMSNTPNFNSKVYNIHQTYPKYHKINILKACMIPTFSIIFRHPKPSPFACHAVPELMVILILIFRITPGKRSSSQGPKSLHTITTCHFPTTGQRQY
jgi:hypothetical protein